MRFLCTRILHNFQMLLEATTKFHIFFYLSLQTLVAAVARTTVMFADQVLKNEHGEEVRVVTHSLRLKAAFVSIITPRELEHAWDQYHRRGNSKLI